MENYEYILEQTHWFLNRLKNKKNIKSGLFNGMLSTKHFVKIEYFGKILKLLEEIHYEPSISDEDVGIECPHFKNTVCNLCFKNDYIERKEEKKIN